jgi:hypothetical protein
MVPSDSQPFDTGAGLNHGWTLLLSILTGFPAIGCASVSALYLHPSAESSWPRGDHTFLHTNYASSDTPDSLELSGSVPTRTLPAVPVALNLGAMLRLGKEDADWAANHARCQDPTEDRQRRRIEELRGDLENRWGHHDKLPGVGCPVGGFEAWTYQTVSADLLYRRFDSELSFASGQERGVKLADVAFSEYTVRFSAVGYSRRYGLGGSLALGYIVPRISRNYGLFPEIGTRGSFTVAVGLQATYTITEWIYVYAPLSIGWSEAPVFGLRSGRLVYYARSDVKYIPSSVGVGLGLGLRIPIMRF